VVRGISGWTKLILSGPCLYFSKRLERGKESKRKKRRNVIHGRKTVIALNYRKGRGRQLGISFHQ
jgi:hypothetical protein